MQNQVPSIQSSRIPLRPHPDGATRIALDENELALTYLISEIEAFERRVSRHSTFTRAYQ